MSVHPIILKSGAKRQQVRWREGSINKSRNFPDSRAGRKAAREFDEQVDALRRQGELAAQMQRRRVLVSDLVADWIKRNAHLATIDQYARDFDLRVLPAFGARYAASLKVADIERWFSDMRAAGAGDPTILRTAAALQSVLSMACRDELLDRNVVQEARKPKQGRTRLPVVVHTNDVERIRLDLLIRGRMRDAVLLELLAYGGPRPESEAIVIRWEQIYDWSMLVRDTKRGTERPVRLVAPLRQTLAAWRSISRPSSPKALVVPTAAGGGWSESDWDNWRDRVFRPSLVWATDLPADTRPRDLRGSFVSMLVHAGRNIVEVAAQAGQSPETALKHYAQVFADDDPADRLSEEEQIMRSRALVRSQFARFALPNTTTGGKPA